MEKQMKKIQRYPIGRDGLTGIYNRGRFYSRVEELLRIEPEKNYILARMDIFRLKIINDLYGRVIGDKLLKRIAYLLEEKYKSNGVYARLREDHFAIFTETEGFDPDELIIYLKEDLFKILPEYDITIHIGIYPVEDPHIPVDIMCDRANLALGMVKESYLQCYCYYGEELRRALLKEQYIVGNMNRALLEEQFQFYLQPVYSIATSAPISAEALVRWIRPEEGLMPPGDFVPIFEKNGFIVKLDLYIWERVCSYLRECLDHGKKVVPISVNVSRLNLYNPHLADILSDLLDKYQLDTSLLKLEITESAYMDNPVQLLEMVKKLKGKGFQILMDDFGSGYSSLNMLMDIPVDILKLDMGFMGAIGKSGRAANLLTSVVRMAKWLDIDVLAEGVESREQLDFLKSIACDKIQGFYYSRPLPVNEYEILLEQPEKILFKKPEDLNLEDFDFNEFMNPNGITNILFNGIIGGMGIYEMEEEELEVLRVNDGYYEIMGATPNGVFRDTKDAFTHVDREDRPVLIKACKTAERTGQVQEIVIRRYHENGSLMWLGLKIRYIGTKGQGSLFFFVIDDITKKRKMEKEKELAQYTKALMSIYEEIISMDFKKDTYEYIYTRFHKAEGICLKKSGLREAFQDYMKTEVCQEDQENGKALFEKALTVKDPGENADSWEYRRVLSNGSVKWYSTVILRIRDNLSLCCTQNITSKKQ